MTRSLQNQFVRSLLVAVACALPAWAQDNIWTNGTGNGSVGDPGNWSMGHTPFYGENAIIASGTQLVINTGQYLAATHIESSIPTYVAGGAIFCNSMTTNSILSTYSNADINVQASMQINGTWNVFATVLAWWQTSNVPIVSIGSSGQVALFAGNKTIMVSIENYGHFDGAGQTLVLGSSLGPAYFINRSGGVVTNLSFNAEGGSTPTPYAINEGSWSFSAGAAHLPVFGNQGLLTLDGTQLTIEDLLDLDGDTSLDSGGWVLRNGAIVTHNNGGDITRLGPATTVRLENGVNFINGLQAVQDIEGRLELAGDTLRLTPAFFGTVSLGGFLRMEPGGRLEIFGGLRITSQDAVLDKAVQEPEPNDVIATYSSSSVAGQLIVEIQNPNLVPAGSSIGLIRDVGDCCFMGGTFGSVLVFGTNEPTSVSYQQHIISLAVGAPSMPGDLNCDGAVNFNDINPFVLALSDPNGYAAAYPNCNIMNGDVNGDGHVDFQDINPFVALLTGGH